METTRRPRVKICCIGSIDEAWTAIRMGASALGLVSSMPSGPGVIPDERIAAIVPPGVASVLLISRQDAAGIVEQQRAAGVNTIQIVDRLTHGTCHDLREAMPGVALIQVIHVTGPGSIHEAMAVAPHVNALLLDGGSPALAVKELGGTGRVHNWEISRTIRERSPVLIYLAGGLNPENVAVAIRTVGPFGLDLCSGVRTNGALDESKLTALFQAAIMG
jgi:phosphoribosylanthranilate isomerase